MATTPWRIISSASPATGGCAPPADPGQARPELGHLPAHRMGRHGGLRPAAAARLLRRAGGCPVVRHSGPGGPRRGHSASQCQAGGRFAAQPSARDPERRPLLAAPLDPASRRRLEAMKWPLLAALAMVAVALIWRERARRAQVAALAVTALALGYAW